MTNIISARKQKSEEKGKSSKDTISIKPLEDLNVAYAMGICSSEAARMDPVLQRHESNWISPSSVTRCSRLAVMARVTSPSFDNSKDIINKFFCSLWEGTSVQYNHQAHRGHTCWREMPAYCSSVHSERILCVRFR